MRKIAVSLLVGLAASSAIASNQYVVRIPAAIEAPAAEPAPPEISAHFLLAGNERAGAFSSALATKGGFIQAIGQNVIFDTMGLTLTGQDYSGAALPDGTFSFGTEDFTIDFWAYYVGPTNEGYSTYSFLFIGGGFGLALGDAGYWNSMMLHIPGANTHIAYPNVNKSSLKNKWNHIALVRSSGKIKLYVNGVGQDARNGGAGYNWGQLYPGNGEGVPREQSIDVSGARIGVHAASAILPLNASFRNFRVTKEALWSTDFTPPGAVEGGAPEIPSAPVSLFLDNAALPRATTGVSYSFDLFERLSMSVGGFNDTDVSWRIANPQALPTGLNLSSAGVIHGTPTQTNYSASLDIEAAYKGSKVMKSFPITVTLPTDPDYEKVALHMGMDNPLTNSFVGGPATLSGNVIAEGDGSRGVSARFDGSYGTFMQVPGINLDTPDWTVEFWVKTSGGTNDMVLLSRHSPGFGPTTWHVSMKTSGKIGVFVREYSAYDMMVSSASVSDGDWHHVAWVKEGSKWSLFIDGAPSASLNWTGASASSTNPIAIGATATGYESSNQRYPFAGNIDEVRITKGKARYTAAFTPERSFPSN